MSDYDEAIAAIIEGAKLHHLGRFLQRHTIQSQGLRRIDDGMKVIDEECPEARDILIPLLDDADPSVRVTVASALVLSRPELALPVLEDIATTCTTIAQQSASTILSFNEVFYPGLCSLCRPDPRHPISEEQKRIGKRLDA